MKIWTKISLALIACLSVVAIVMAALALSGPTGPVVQSGGHSEASGGTHPTTTYMPTITLPPVTTTTVAPAKVIPNQVSTTTVAPAKPKIAPVVTPTTVPMPAPTTTTSPKISAPTGPQSVTPTTGLRSPSVVTIAASVVTALTGDLGDCRTSPTYGCFAITVHVGGIGPIPVGAITYKIDDSTGVLVTSGGNPEPGQDVLVGSLPANVITNGFTYVVTFAYTGYVTTSTGALKG